MSDARTFQAPFKYQVWEVPELAGARGDQPESSDDVPAEENVLYEEAYLKGYTAGSAEIRTQHSDWNSNATRIFTTLERAIKEIDEGTIEELARLAAIVAQQVIQAELVLNPDLITNVVQNLVSQLPAGYKKVQIALHPEDLETLSRWLDKQEDLDTGICTLVASDVLDRGDCQLTTDDSHINAELHSHVQNIISSSIEDMLGLPLNRESDAHG